MNKKHQFALLVSCLLLGLSSQVAAQSQPNYKPQQNQAAPQLNFGVVDFKRCVEESKLGKSEQATFESLKTQMSTLLEKGEQELEEIAKQVKDPDDSLSPTALENLQKKYQALAQELMRSQNQYYQILNQTNVKVIQSLTTKVGEAATAVAKSKNLNLVLNNEACFYNLPEADITNAVIAELDRRFSSQDASSQNKPTGSTQTAPPAAQANPPAQSSSQPNYNQKPNSPQNYNRPGR